MKLICKNGQQGYVLILSAIIISLAIIMGTYIVHRSIVFDTFARTSIDREQAKLLAMSGIQIAMSELARAANKEKKEEGAKKSAGTLKIKQDKALLSAVLPFINCVQTFTLRDEVDGIEGTIQLHISSENGKIDINRVYDFDRHTFRGKWADILMHMFATLEKQYKVDDLFKSLQNFLKGRNHVVNDVSELITIKKFKIFKDNLFYTIPSKKVTKKNEVYLSDLFTVWSRSDKLNPWLLSNSVRELLSLKQAECGDVDKKRKVVQEWLKKFKHEMSWPADWNRLLRPIYERDFNSLPKHIDSILDTEFRAHTFAIVSYGEFRTIQQGVLAIVERMKVMSKTNEIRFKVKVKKLYWL